MSQWEPDILVTETLVHALLAEQWPELQIESLHFLAQNWENTAYCVNQDWIFRFPIRRVVVPLISREQYLLPKLAQCLPTPVPDPLYLGQPTDRFPYPFFGHKKVPGINACRVDLQLSHYQESAISVANFLKVLHSLNVADLDLGGMDHIIFDRTDKSSMFKKLHKRLKVVRQTFILDRYKTAIKQICGRAEQVNLKSYQPTLIHGDLHHSRLLFSDDLKLSGVIDWGDLGVSHPIVDLGLVYQFFPPAVHEYFFAVYGDVHQSLLDYAKFLALYYGISLLWYGDLNDDRRLVEGSMKTLDYLL